MSSWRTHALIGGVAGLALARALDTLPHGAIGRLAAAQLQAAGVAGALLTIGLVAGSAVLALLPDIDERHSKVSQWAHAIIALATAPIAGLAGWMLASSGRLHVAPIGAAAALSLLGVVVIGPSLGFALLRMLRAGVGGHRRLTHSLLLAALLGAAAAGLWALGLQVSATVPGALAYAIVVHAPGDIVTREGIMPIWPLSTWTLRIPLGSFGEPAAAAAALLAAVVLWTR